ncbi:MAG: alpha amylase catalytic subunit [Spirochaetaceae bacterium]|nr:alpha amylase catalytic subunit [Spirochaetaceae bacterium]MCF7949609.1 alpha amylase catalytic subunit [Spirochaetia bacterium]MCF7951517.1 alpha amylase catalytic subunit [Spirochaetaceae bacterium]
MRVRFHISRFSRDRYRFSEALFSKEGHVISTDQKAVVQLVEAINKKRNVNRYPQLRASAAEVYALALLHEISHHVVHLYIEEHGSDIFTQLDQHLRQELGDAQVEDSLTAMIDHYPPAPVYSGEETAKEHLHKTDQERPNTEIYLEEMLLVWLSNLNPALKLYHELIDDTALTTESNYKQVVKTAYLFFEQLPGVGDTALNLIDFLQVPAHEAPHSILAQLNYVVGHWTNYLGPYAEKLLRGIDYLKEEQRPSFPPGPGPSRTPDYSSLEFDYEAFSQDTVWMPQVVLLAKSALVWLDQLTRSYGRTIHRLDQIPDEELNRLADMGFNALWLIGLWERSSASKTIKRSCGNPEAEASAYSLKRYEIADELGGWEALHNLADRCNRRGIRLASDMVPNHTGIDGDWVYDHPDWFLQLPDPPYPSYTYNSQNLSDHPDVGIYLEDHYYDRTDAALTFKWQHFPSQQTRYIYHGNDGTSMPWNDTAQLDFLNPETREALIQTILHVAHNFSIIRFDAAMTLARKHIHRLWYPAPGSGGDISGRSQYGMSNEEFYRRMPQEFWREVVDRVAAEAPETLLLAEAFWMMEGFFVRTLGMHRVYNSAFMNMLKSEENEKYKNTIKSTISFEPEILKRFVNFMNNPDEDTAIAQFGDGDKYFGVCTLMVTMPGLPMFGHGQIEGYHEKYGMEYRRAYWNEIPNWDLINRHYQSIFPLMKKRYLFADSENFRLYDMYRENGEADHNVFAYSNRSGNETALITYNNAFNSTAGRIHTSSPFATKGADGNRSARQYSLAEGLQILNEHNYFTIFREQRSGKWFIRENSTLNRQGMFIHLHGYESHVYLDFYQVQDTDGLYRKLYETLDGRGIYDIELRKKELFLEPIHLAFRRFLQSPLITPIRQALYKGTGLKKIPFDDYWSYYDDFLDECLRLGYGSSGHKAAAIKHFQKNLEAIGTLSTSSNPLILPHPPNREGYYHRGLTIMPEAPLLMLGWTLLTPLQEFIQADSNYSTAAECAADLLLPQQFVKSFREQGVEEKSLPHLYKLMLVTVSQQNWLSLLGDGGEPLGTKPPVDNRPPASDLVLEQIIREPFTATFLDLHHDNNQEWYKGESMQELFWWLNTIALLAQIKSGKSGLQSEEVFAYIKRWLRAEESAEYRIELLLESSVL